jgi:hypothetical protein
MRQLTLAGVNKVIQRTLEKVSILAGRDGVHPRDQAVFLAGALWGANLHEKPYEGWMCSGASKKFTRDAVKSIQQELKKVL